MTVAESPRIIPLSPESVLARTIYGGYLAVPMWNIDVVPGIVRDGVIEPATSAVVGALARPGMNVVNAGANFGYYTVYYAQLLQRNGVVYSIEANEYVLPYLMRTIFWAGYPDTIRLYHAAVAETDDVKLKLTFDPQYLGGGSAVQQIKFPDLADTLQDALWERVSLAGDFNADRQWRIGTPHYVTVEATTKTLDSICKDAARIDLLHMDIEGFEPHALAGASQVLARSPNITIIMEWSPTYARLEGHAAVCREMMTKLFNTGFSFFRIRSDKWNQDRTLPLLTAISSFDVLMDTPHSDLLVTRSLARASDPFRFELTS